MEFSRLSPTKGVRSEENVRCYHGGLASGVSQQHSYSRAHASDLLEIQAFNGGELRR